MRVVVGTENLQGCGLRRLGDDSFCRVISTLAIAAAAAATKRKVYESIRLARGLMMFIYERELFEFRRYIEGIFVYLIKSELFRDIFITSGTCATVGQVLGLDRESHEVVYI